MIWWCKKLKSWQHGREDMSSLGGQITLIELSMAIFLVYHSSLFKILATVANEIERLKREFL